MGEVSLRLIFFFNNEQVSRLNLYAIEKSLYFFSTLMERIMLALVVSVKRLKKEVDGVKVVAHEITLVDILAVTEKMSHCIFWGKIGSF